MESVYLQGLRDAKGLLDDGIFSKEEFEGEKAKCVYLQGLRDAKGLLDDGIFSKEEFEREKAKLTAERDVRAQPPSHQTPSTVDTPEQLPDIQATQAVLHRFFKEAVPCVARIASDSAACSKARDFSGSGDAFVERVKKELDRPPGMRWLCDCPLLHPIV